MENVHFRKQHTIGNYIVDFCAPSQKLIIELDGSQHLEQKDYDKERTAYLNAKGYKVLRFWNHQVMDQLDQVLNHIWNTLKENPGNTQPFPHHQNTSKYGGLKIKVKVTLQVTFTF